MTNEKTSSDAAHRGTWRRLRATFDEASARLPQALQAEGFGVITQIDLQQTLKAKLGVDFRRYKIFGACNPSFAHAALETDPRVGLLLPCNVVLFENDDRSVMLGIIDPMEQLGSKNGPLGEVARTIGDRLARVGEKLSA